MNCDFYFDPGCCQSISLQEELRNDFVMTIALVRTREVSSIIVCTYVTTFIIGQMVHHLFIEVECGCD